MKKEPLEYLKRPHKFEIHSFRPMFKKNMQATQNSLGQNGLSIGEPAFYP